MISSMNGKMVVKPVVKFTEKIVAEIIDVERKAFGNGGLQNEWLLVPFLRYGRVFVAELEGQIIGSAQFIRTWTEPETVYFYGVSLQPKHRGKGLGTDFLGRILESLKKEGFSKIILSVSPENKGAVHLYQDKLGFRRIRLARDEYGTGEDRYIMECIL